MPDIVTCPACGAANPAGSEWCGQCYASFTAASSPSVSDTSRSTQPAQPQPGRARPAPPIGAPRGPLGPPAPPARPDRPPGVPLPPPGTTTGIVTDGWTCKVCGAVNLVSVDSCRSCQTSIYETFGAGEDDRSEVEPSRAALWGLLPGGGHFKVGESALGLAVAGLLLASLAFGILMIGGNRRPVGIVLVVFTVIAWGISIHDATRLAAGNEDAVLLRPRVVTSAMGLIFMLVIVAAVSITSEGTTP